MIRDWIFAFRTFRRSKVFALTALVIFVFGIGSTATVFSVIDAVLLRPASFIDSRSIVHIEAAEGKEDWDHLPPKIFARLRSGTSSFDQVAGLQNALFTVTGIPQPDQVFGQSVTGNLFVLLPARALIGRTLNHGDEQLNAAPVVLLSYKGWQQLFAADPQVVGKSARIDGVSSTVIGVMPSDFVLPGSGAVMWNALRLSSAELASPNARSIDTIARLPKSVSVGSAQAAINILSSTLERNSDQSARPERLRVTSWHDEPEHELKVTLWLALGMVSALLLIGCANLSSILLARGIGRRRDFAIRLAIGASRFQLIRQQMIEICLLAVMAFTVALPASAGTLNVIRNYLLNLHLGLPNLALVHLNGLVFLFSFGVALSAGLLAGLLPAFSATSIDLSTGLREAGTHLATGNRVKRLMYLLVSIETGVAMMLLLTSGLLVRSLVRLVTEDHGLRPEHVLTMRLPTGSWQGSPIEKTPEEQQRQIRRYLDILSSAQMIHGVASAALASSLPLSHVSVATRLLSPHESATNRPEEIMPRAQAVTEDYFQVMGIPLLSGRTFDVHDQASKGKTALVNEAFMRAYFGGKNPVGKSLQSPEANGSLRIIGLVKDSPHLDYAEAVEPEVYMNFRQELLTPFLTGLAVRSNDDPERLSISMRSELLLSHPDQAVVQVQPLSRLIDDNIGRPRFSAWLFSMFASLALMLAGVGIYGVVTYATASRRHEFGIRMALGANASGLFRLAMVQSLVPVFVGTIVGIVAAGLTGRLIASLLYKTSQFDSGTWSLSVFVCLLLAFVAAAVPAWQICRIIPASALRE